jgi:hypothetical protein
MDLAAVYDLVIEQGTTFSRTFRWEDSDGVAIDLGSYTLRMNIRSTKESSTTIATSEGSTPTIVIVAPGGTGIFTVSISSEYTEVMDFNRAVYDIEAYDDSDPSVVYRVVKGSVYLDKEVTR